MSEVSWDQSIRSFVGQAGSASPTPGGGSVAALVAALGASMTSMVANLSQGEKFAAVRQQVEETLREMERLSVSSEELLHADVASFERYMDALRLPKGSDEEKNERRRALEEAASRAIEVPLRLIELCREGLAHTLRIAEGSNKNVVSDLGIGAILFEAAAQSALLTVEINLGALRDEKQKTLYSSRAAALIRDIASLKAEALRISRSRML